MRVHQHPNKPLILSLIKDDLINTKLLLHLTDIGLDPSDYLLRLSDTILELIGVPDNDLFYFQFMDMKRKVTRMDISESREPLNGLAIKIFQQLIKHRQS